MGIKSTPYKKCYLIWERLLKDCSLEKNPYKTPMSLFNLEIAIGEISGIDSRTIKKYILWLIRFRFIEQKGTKYYLVPEGERLR